MPLKRKPLKAYAEVRSCLIKYRWVGALVVLLSLRSCGQSDLHISCQPNDSTNSNIQAIERLLK